MLNGQTTVNHMPNIPVNKRVLWSDGLLLLPQHFEQQEAYFSHHVRELNQQLIQQVFGISKLGIDKDDLSRGLLRFTQLCGIFPDGTPFNADLPVDLPEPLPIKASDEGQIIALVIGTQGLAYPPAEVVSALVPIQEKNSASHIQARYAVEEFTVDQEGEILQLGALRLRVCRWADVSGFDVAIPMVKIHAVGSKGEIQLDPMFSPPLLDLRGSHYLWAEVEGVIQLLKHRADWQMQRLNQPQSTSLLETSDFLLLQTLLRYESALLLKLHLKPCVPLDVYEVLLALACELGAVQHPPIRMTMATKWNPQDPCSTYIPILLQIKNMLSRIRTRLAVEMQFKMASDGTYMGTQLLPLLSAQDRIVLAVNAQVPDDWMWQRFIGQTVVSASDNLVDKIRLQLPGIELQHLATTPPELPLQAGWHYFELQKNSRGWQELMATRNIGLHITGQWPGLNIKGWLFQARAGMLEGQL